MAKRYWVVKTEPSTYSIFSLRDDKVGVWDGVRNFQARSHLEEMKSGDLVFIYHSSVPDKGIYGVGEVVGPSFPDESQFNPKSPYFEPRALKNKPIWVARHIKFKKILPKPILLTEMKDKKSLIGLSLLQKGSRLSVQPLSRAHFETILKLGSQAN